MCRHGNAEQGFTLIEMIAVIVLLGVLATGATIFLSDGVRIYQDDARRTELSHQARFVIEKISRELRNALPGSIRVGSSGSVQCLEFMPILAASSYLQSLAAAPNEFVEVVTHADLTASSFSGARMAVYALDNTRVYSTTTQSLATVDAISDDSPLYAGDSSGDNLLTIDLSSAHSFPLDSPQRRFYIVNDRISYCASDGWITRYQGYGSAGASQPLPPDIATYGGSSFPIAEHIRLADNGAVTVFNYQPGVLARSGVVHLDMRFYDDEASDEWLRFSHDVFVRNAL